MHNTTQFVLCRVTKLHQKRPQHNGNVEYPEFWGLEPSGMRRCRWASSSRSFEGSWCLHESSCTACSPTILRCGRKHSPNDRASVQLHPREILKSRHRQLSDLTAMSWRGHVTKQLPSACGGNTPAILPVSNMWRQDVNSVLNELQRSGYRVLRVRQLTLELREFKIRHPVRSVWAAYCYNRHLYLLQTTNTASAAHVACTLAQVSRQLRHLTASQRYCWAPTCLGRDDAIHTHNTYILQIH